MLDSLFIEAALEPLVKLRHTKQHYEGQDLIKARLARLPLVCLQSTSLVYVILINGF